MTSRPHPTWQRLVDAATAMAIEGPVEAITVDAVLTRSGVSKGSLYHHFEDFSDLIETALVDLFVTSVDNNAAAIRQVFDKAVDRQSFVEGLARVTRATQGSELRHVRFRRARLLSYAEGHPRLMQKMSREQARLTRVYTQMFRTAQDKGWFNKDFDPQVAAVFIQAYTIGKIVDDVSSEPMDNEAWIALIMKIVDRVFI